MVVKGRDNVEKIILIKDDTIIERFKETIKLTDLKVDDYIITIGDPNDAGQIEAKFIRFLPPPPPIGRSLKPFDILPNMRKRLKA